MFRYRTAGESHGPCLTVLIEGVPSGIEVTEEDINRDLARRQTGYGRGGRMAIEKDRVEMVGGVRWGKTTGAPVAFLIRNSDWGNWKEGMSPDPVHRGSLPALTKVRPGHADYPGALKYRHDDARNVLERSSARETAGRVAAGALAKAALKVFEIRIGSFVTSIGGVEGEFGADFAENHSRAESSDLRMTDLDASHRARKLIEEARQEGDTLGGAFVCFAEGLPAGLGSHVSGQTRLDGRIAGALVSIPAVKAVEIGLGFKVATLKGSEVHDRIYPGGLLELRRGMVKRRTNNAGGLEGGMTNGQILVIRGAMKPISTLLQGLDSVNLGTLQPDRSDYERSDVCAVPAASVVAENVVAFEIARAFLAKFGGDTLADVRAAYDHWSAAVRSLAP